MLSLVRLTGKEDSNNEKRISCKEDCARKEALARGDHYELPTAPIRHSGRSSKNTEGDQQRDRRTGC